MLGTIFKNLKTSFKKELYRTGKLLKRKMDWITDILIGLISWRYHHIERKSINQSQVTITTDKTEIKGTSVFTGSNLEFIIINETSTPTYISELPKLYLRVYYDWTKLWCMKKELITEYVDLQESKTTPIKIEGRKTREYFNYRLRTEFFKWIREDIENDKIRYITIFLEFYNDVNKKTKKTKPVKLNKEIYDSKVQRNLNIDKMKDITNQLEN